MQDSSAQAGSASAGRSQAAHAYKPHRVEPLYPQESVAFARTVFKWESAITEQYGVESFDSNEFNVDVGHSRELLKSRYTVSLNAGGTVGASAIDALSIDSANSGPAPTSTQVTFDNVSLTSAVTTVSEPSPSAFTGPGVMGLAAVWPSGSAEVKDNHWRLRAEFDRCRLTPRGSFRFVSLLP